MALRAEGVPALELGRSLATIAAEKADSGLHPRFRLIASRLLLPTTDYFDAVRYDPGYLTDLRMRRSDDPREFLYWNLRALDWARLEMPPCSDIATSELADALGRAIPNGRFDVRSFVAGALSDPDVLSHALCVYVNFYGSWDDAIAIAEVVGFKYPQVFRSDDGARALMLSACAIGIGRSDAACRGIFAAARRQWESPYERFLGEMRLATLEVKRFGDRRETERALNRARNAALDLARRGYLTEDSAFCEGLVLNLAALAHVKARDYTRAGRLLEDGRRKLDSAPNELIAMPADLADRYRITLLQNVAILRLARSDWSEAVVAFDIALRTAELIHVGSVGETLSLLGFALMRTQDSRAIPVLERAEAILRQDVSLPRLRQVRGLLAVATADIGREDDAAHWLALRREIELEPRALSMRADDPHPR